MDQLLSTHSRIQGLLIAAAVCIGGFLVGTTGIVISGVVVRTLGLGQTAVVEVIQENYIQIGFAFFGAVYFRVRQDSSRLLRIRRPTLIDIGWMALLALVLPYFDAAVSALLTAGGLAHPSVGVNGQGIQSLLAARPLLWPLAFVALYLFAAPAEEFIYRGIIHGELRAAFDRISRTILGGLFFGLMHALVGLLTPSVALLGSFYWGLSAIAPGLLWGYAYERTDNLLVTSTAHAVSWTIPLAGLLPFV